MSEIQNFGDILEKVEPRQHPQHKKRTLIEANREAIYMARDRGCIWVDIAKTLSENGFVVSPDSLRRTMNEKPRDLKKYPRKMIVKRKPKQQSRQSSITIKGREEDRIGKENSNVNGGIALNTAYSV